MKNICDWNNCFDTGEYKAPIEKDNSKRYRLLCLAHVKEFNKNWNYFVTSEIISNIFYASTRLEIPTNKSKRTSQYHQTRPVQ